MKHADRMRWWATAAVVLGGAVGALAACNLVVDSGSYHVGDLDGSMVTVVNEAGSTDGGLSEAGLEAGPPATCGSTALPTSMDFQNLVSTCVLAVSCDPGYFLVNISTCVTYDYIHAYDSLSFLATPTPIQNCSDYLMREGTSIATPASCTDTNSDFDEGSCTSNVATSCYYSTGSEGYGNTVTSCVGVGTCQIYDTDDAGDEAAGCYLGPCSDTDGNQHCYNNGNEIYTCFNGGAYGGPCPTESLCGTIGGSVNCYYQTPSCTTPGTTCNNGALSVCSASPVSSGATDEVVSYNCGTSGLQCVLDDAGSGQCLSPGCTESTGDGEGGVLGCVESCASGTGVITFCVGGVPGTYDCTANGFTGCYYDTSTASPITYCVY